MLVSPLSPVDDPPPVIHCLSVMKLFWTPFTTLNRHSLQTRSFSQQIFVDVYYAFSHFLGEKIEEWAKQTPGRRGLPFTVRKLTLSYAFQWKLAIKISNFNFLGREAQSEVNRECMLLPSGPSKFSLLCFLTVRMELEAVYVMNLGLPLLQSV